MNDLYLKEILESMIVRLTMDELSLLKIGMLTNKSDCELGKAIDNAILELGKGRLLLEADIK